MTAAYVLNFNGRATAKLWSGTRIVPDTLTFPAALRVMIGVGVACIGALIILLLSPLLSLYGSLFGIPQLASITAVLNALALLILITSVPLGWTLSFAGLTLEWLTRHRAKRKRKVKRRYRAYSSEKPSERLCARPSPYIREQLIQPDASEVVDELATDRTDRRASHRLS